MIMVSKSPSRVLPYNFLIFHSSRIRAENLRTPWLLNTSINEHWNQYLKTRWSDVRVLSCIEWRQLNNPLSSGNSILFGPFWCSFELPLGSKWDPPISLLGLHEWDTHYLHLHVRASFAFLSYILMRTEFLQYRHVGRGSLVWYKKANWWSTCKGPSRSEQVLRGSHMEKRAISWMSFLVRRQEFEEKNYVLKIGVSVPMIDVHEKKTSYEVMVSFTTCEQCHDLEMWNLHIKIFSENKIITETFQISFRACFVRKPLQTLPVSQPWLKM